MRYSQSFTSSMDVISDRRPSRPTSFSLYTAPAPGPGPALILPTSGPRLRLVKPGTHQRSNRAKPVDANELSRRLLIVLAQQKHNEKLAEAAANKENSSFADRKLAAMKVQRRLSLWTQPQTTTADVVVDPMPKSPTTEPPQKDAAAATAVPLSPTKPAEPALPTEPPHKVHTSPRTLASAVAAASRHAHKAHENPGPFPSQPYVPLRAAQQFSDTTAVPLPVPVTAHKHVKPGSKKPLRRPRSSVQPLSGGFVTELSAPPMMPSHPRSGSAVAPPKTAPDSAAAQAQTHDVPLPEGGDGSPTNPARQHTATVTPPSCPSGDGAALCSNHSNTSNTSSGTSTSSDSNNKHDAKLTTSGMSAKNVRASLSCPSELTLTARAHKKLYRLTYHHPSRRAEAVEADESDEPADQLPPLLPPLSPRSFGEHVRVDWSQSDETVVGTDPAAETSPITAAAVEPPVPEKAPPLPPMPALAAPAPVIPAVPRERPRERLRQTKSLWALRSRLSFSRDKHPPPQPLTLGHGSAVSSPSPPLVSPTLKSPKSGILSL